MPVTTKVMPRSFSYNGLILPDPNPQMSPEQVRDSYSAQYPEITSASIEGPDASGEKIQYRFLKVIGTKG